MRKPTVLLLTITLFAGVSLAAAQSQPPPPPEKKKPRKVWTNEDLSGLGGRINVVGQEAPPPSEVNPAQSPKSAPDYTWEQLDALRDTRAQLENELPSARAALENINNEYRAATDPVRIDAILQARTQQEERIANLEQQLQQVNADIATVEKLTKGKKRPAKAKPVAPKPAATQPEGAGQPQEQKPPAEQPPPPPPPPPSS